MNERIRVAMIIHAYYPRVGGAEQQLGALAPLLQSHGVEVHILTRRFPGLAPFEIVNGVPVHRLPVPGSKPMAALSFTLAAQPLLRRLRPHVVHAHDLRSPTTTAVAAKCLLGVPVIAKVLRGGVLGDLVKLRQGAFGAQRAALFRRHVDMFVAISAEIDAELARMGVPQERRAFIPNGVDTERFAPLSPAEKRALRANLGLPEGPIVVFMGRLMPEKRVDQLIGVWPAVRAVHPDAELLILGTGNQEAALKQSAGAGVRFAGLIDDVAPYLRASDVFVLPSATEGLSNALLEALASGLPALATAVGGALDVIKHGENGWLIRPDQPAELQAAIVQLLDNPEQRASLGLRGRERVVRDYAMPATARRLVALYQQLAVARQVWKEAA